MTTDHLWALLAAAATLLAVIALLSMKQIDRPRQSYEQGERDMRAFRQALEDGIIEVDESGQVVYAKGQEPEDR